MTVPKICIFHAITVHLDLSLLLVHWKPKPIPFDICCILVTVVMAPVVRIDPNGCRALLSHDDVIDDSKVHGWEVFLKKFEGYSIHVAKVFSQTLDGFRDKVGDVRLELTKDFMSRET
jgi:hypothetical protein